MSTKDFNADDSLLTLICGPGGLAVSVVAGTPILVGSMLVVPESSVTYDAAKVQYFAARRRGQLRDVPKAGSQAWTQGQKLYWDDTAKNFTTTVGSNTVQGSALVAALSADTTGFVVLAGLIN